MPLDPTQKTATDLITGALRKTGQYAAGEPIAASDMNDALDVLNALLDSKSNNNYLIPNNRENIITFNPGQMYYTVGDGGDIDIQRPLRITTSYTRITSTSSTVDFACESRPLEEYATIGLKSQPGPWPKWLYYNPTYPLGGFYLWPVPSQGGEFHFWTEGIFQSADLTTPLYLPQGYYNYLQFFLAELLMIDYGVQVPPDILRLRREFEKDIRSNNTYVGKNIAVDAAIVPGNANNAGWILTGGF